MRRTAERTRDAAPVTREPEAPATPLHRLLALQQSAGNQSVARFLARQPAATAPAPALPTAEVLTERIANCIGVWETNRGGDAPNPTESSLDTVAGVKASMATIEQATMPYALDALKRNASLRKLASPELTKEEINDAIARVTAVKTLLDAVKTAADAGTSADDFIKGLTDLRHPRPEEVGREPRRLAAVGGPADANNPAETGYGGNIWATYKRLCNP